MEQRIPSGVLTTDSSGKAGMASTLLQSDRDTDFVRDYASGTHRYCLAYRAFLENTDQKANAYRHIKPLVKAIRRHRVFIDAGAGDGVFTSRFGSYFPRTIAIEPNSHFTRTLRASCPGIEMLPCKIADAQPAVSAQLVLCSHVLFHVNETRWLEHIAKLASWLDRHGTLVLLLQNQGSDCIRMMRDFDLVPGNLAATAMEFKAMYSADFDVTLTKIPCCVHASEIDAAYLIAEFMLNCLDDIGVIERHVLSEYVISHFLTPEGAFRFSCDQDMITVSRKVRP